MRAGVVSALESVLHTRSPRPLSLHPHGPSVPFLHHSSTHPAPGSAHLSHGNPPSSFIASVVQVGVSSDLVGSRAMDTPHYTAAVVHLNDLRALILLRP